MGRNSDRDFQPRRDLAQARPLAVAKSHAAELLGVSEDYFDEHVRPEIRVVRGPGRRVLVPVAELEKWLERNAVFALDGFPR